MIDPESFADNKETAKKISPPLIRREVYFLDLAAIKIGYPKRISKERRGGKGQRGAPNFRRGGLGFRGCPATLFFQIVHRFYEKVYNPARNAQGAYIGRVLITWKKAGIRSDWEY
jgi:hypothetical protein